MTAELPEAQQQQYLSSIPAGRFGQVSEIAQRRLPGSPAMKPATFQAP